jgi:hypothetical protein
METQFSEKWFVTSAMVTVHRVARPVAHPVKDHRV